LISMPEAIAETPLDNSESEADDGVPTDCPVLTEHEMVSVLQHWEADGKERLHEPVLGQINMERAIETGREGLSFLGDHLTIPEEMLDFSSTNAYLCQNQTNPNEQFLAPVYSYWAVSFANEYLNVNMTVNAVMGQIWKAEILARQVMGEGSQVLLRMDQANVSKTMAAFMSSVGINPDGTGEVFVSYGIVSASMDILNDSLLIYSDVKVVSKAAFDSEFMVASQSFSGGKASAVINAVGNYADEGLWEISKFKMYLSASE